MSISKSILDQLGIDNFKNEKIDIIRVEKNLDQYLKFIKVPKGASWGYDLRRGGGDGNAIVYCKILIQNLFGKIGTYKYLKDITDFGTDKQGCVIYAKIKSMNLDIECGRLNRKGDKRDIVISKKNK